MAEGVSIIWDGLTEFRDRIDELIEKADKAAQRAVTDGGHLIERRAKQYAPVQKGTLRRSIHVDSIEKLGPGRYQSLTGPTVVYARIQELGGTIRPKTDKLSKNGVPYGLAFKGSKGVVLLPPGQTVTIRGTHYMSRAFNESVPGLRELYRLAFREALES